MSIFGDVVPVPTPETQPYFDALADNRLSLPVCLSCGRAFFPPTSVCPFCASRDVQWRDMSGRASLYSFSIIAKPWEQWGLPGPMSVALVELEEGPRLVSTVIGCPQTPEGLVLDMPLQAAYRSFGDGMTLLCFEPAGEIQ